MMPRTDSWMNTINTTSFRIVASVYLAAFDSTAVVVAILFFRWEPSAMQVRVLTGVAVGILTMMGFDVAQFWVKRFSAAEYVTAKNGKATPATPSGGA